MNRHYRLIRDWHRFIAALQDCVMQIRRMRFAWIERDNHALVLEIDFYVLHSGNVLQHRSQFAHAFITIFTFRGDFDGFQNRVAARSGKNGSAGSRSPGHAGSTAFWLSLNLTFEASALVAPPL